MNCRLTLTLLLLLAPAASAGFAIGSTEAGTRGLAIYNDFPLHRQTYLGQRIEAQFTVMADEPMAFTPQLVGVVAGNPNPAPLLYEWVRLDWDGESAELSGEAPAGTRALKVRANETVVVHLKALLAEPNAQTMRAIRQDAAVTRQNRDEDQGPRQVDAWVSLVEVPDPEKADGPQLTVRRNIHLRLVHDLVDMPARGRFVPESTELRTGGERAWGRFELASQGKFEVRPSRTLEAPLTLLIDGAPAGTLVPGVPSVTLALPAGNHTLTYRADGPGWVTMHDEAGTRVAALEYVPHPGSLVGLWAALAAILASAAGLFLLFFFRGRRRDPKQVTFTAVTKPKPPMRL